MKTILRNFISVLRRYKLATALNVLGLSVAFAAFMIIMMQVDYDRNFDRFHPDTENIFRMEVNMQEKWAALNNVPLAEYLFESSPHVVAGAIIQQWSEDLFFSTDTLGVRSFFKERNMLVTPGFTAVFPFRMAEGSDRALEDPEKVLIPQSLARRLFGSEAATGRSLFDRHKTYTVGGVYMDFPANASIENVIYVPFVKTEENSSWTYWAYQCYFRLDAAENIAGLMEGFGERLKGTPFLKANTEPAPKPMSEVFRFTALPDLHFDMDVQYDKTPKTARQTVWTLFAVALLVILIGGINYFNFSNALAPKRIKSINIQKVTGGSNRMIRTALVLEPVAVCFVSWLIALALVNLAQDTPVATLVGGGIAPESHLQQVWPAGLLALLTGFAAGIYPAFYLTSFSPALALKGNFGLSPKGRRFRNVLVGVQFVTSFILIICASFIYLQNRYMQHSPLGYDRDELIVVPNLNDRVRSQPDALSQKLESFSGTVGVTYANDLLSGRDFYSLWGGKYHDRRIQFQHIGVAPSFLQVMGIEVTDGRDFRPDDEHTQGGAFIFNKKAREDFEIALGERIDGMEIIGFMPDLKIASFRMAVEPLGFYVKGKGDYGVAYVRMAAGSDLRAAMMHVRSVLREFDADYPFEVRFFDEVLNRLYEKEQKTGLLITLFSLVAIFISIVGVFGLVVFDSEYRRKEIGIRKVFGSTTREILVVFNKTYVRILCLCFVPAAPVAWYAVARWLENFAYKTPIYWWVYPAAFAAVFLLTVATVTFQNWRAANMNPIESIKTE